MDLVIVGSVAIDDVETPAGRREISMGGSAIYASLAASKIAKTGIVGIIGEDYPEETLSLLKEKNIDLKGLEKVSGKTFRWKGRYDNHSRAETLDTQLNVFADFSPKLPEDYINTKYLFLGNIHPQLQLDVIKQARNPEIIAADTMNYWIENTPELLLEVIKKVNILFINEDEIVALERQCYKGKSLYINHLESASRTLLRYVKNCIIIKRGSQGSQLVDRYTTINIPAYNVENIVDTTGAGDAYAGGFMGSLVKGGHKHPDIERHAMIFGTLTASFNIESFSFDRLAEVTFDDIQNRGSGELKVIDVSTLRYDW